jgi:hypothetical protein
MTGMRLVSTFGSCYGLCKELKAQQEENKPKCECASCGNSTWIPTAIVNASVYSPQAVERRQKAWRRIDKDSWKKANAELLRKNRNKPKVAERKKYHAALRKTTHPTAAK